MGNCLLNFGLLPYANKVWRQILKNYIRPVTYWQHFEAETEKLKDFQKCSRLYLTIRKAHINVEIQFRA